MDSSKFDKGDLVIVRRKEGKYEFALVDKFFGSLRSSTAYVSLADAL